MDKGAEKADIEMTNYLFNHINIPADASNLKY